MNSKTTSENEIPPPSAQELRLYDVTARMGEQQLEAVKKQGDLQNLLYGLAPQAIEGLPGLMSAPSKNVTDELVGLDLARIRRGGEASDVERALIDNSAETSLGLGLSDIGYGNQAIRAMVAKELGGKRGIPSESLGLLTGEVGRQQEQLGRTVRGQRAQNMLRYPQAAGRTVGVQSEALRSFQEQLRNKAFVQRLNLLNSIAKPGLGLAQSGDVSGALSNLGQQRAAQASTAGKASDPAKAISAGASAYMAYALATL